MLSLKDIKKNKEIRTQLRWDLTPESNAIGEAITSQEDFNRLEKGAEARRGYFFFINVWNFQASLILVKNEKYSSKIIGEIKEMHRNALLEAIAETGGYINRNGLYPINETIKK